MSATMTTRPRRRPSFPTAPLPPSPAAADKPRRRDSATYLPSHRRGPAASSAPSAPLAHLRALRRLPRRTGAALALALLALLAVYAWTRAYELQLEFAVFSRRWVADAVDRVDALHGCFEPAAVSPHYNLSAHHAPRRHQLSPGIALRRGMSCYDYAGTIGEVDVDYGGGDGGDGVVTYHTYWRSDLSAFGPRQADTLTAFLATQPLARSRLVLWSNGAAALAASPHVAPFLRDWPAHVEVRQADVAELARGTALEAMLGPGGAAAKALFDGRAWVDGDAVRLLVLWHYGGVWLDMDMVLTRDLHTLLESEWMMQWDCYDKPYFALNGALMHFRRASPYLCEAFHLMASSAPPPPNSFAWGSHLYARLHAALLAAHVKPFAVLPWCFADPRNCRNDIRFPDPYEPDPAWWGGAPWAGTRAGGGAGQAREVGLARPQSGRQEFEGKLGMVFSVHTHNQWDRGWARGGWMRRLVDTYEARVAGLRAAGADDRIE